MFKPALGVAQSEALRCFDGRKEAWIAGPIGSGRSTLLRALDEQRPNLTVIDLPLASEADAGATLSLLALSALPPADRKGLMSSPPRRIAEALGEADARLVIRVPGSWTTPSDPDGPASRAVADLAALARVPGTLVIADSEVDPLALGFNPECFIRLPGHRTRFSEALDWGGYADAARALARRVPTPVEASPLVWRLAVGAVALGAPIDAVVSRCAARDTGYSALVDLLVARLAERPDIERAVSRFVALRRPVPAETLLAITAPPPEHAALLTHALGYGEPVRLSPSLRRRLQERVGRAESVGNLRRTHAEAAAYRRSLDGAFDPSTVLSWQGMEAWTEKVHHLASGGAETIEEWSRQILPRRELYWDRARWLSKVEHDYAAASRVYAACAARFPDDDYARHYEAWNLEQARGDREAVIAGYRSAVDLAPANVWWNARYITALIRADRPIEARRAWALALDRIDPDGDALERDPWLAINLHHSVAEAWEQRGAWATARSVLARIPARHIAAVRDARKGYASLVERIEAKEAEEWARFEVWASTLARPPWSEVPAVVATIREMVPHIPPPIADDGEDGPSLTWSRPGVLVQIELTGPGLVDWFAVDRLSNESDGSDAPTTLHAPTLRYWLQRASDE